MIYNESFTVINRSFFPGRQENTARGMTNLQFVKILFIQNNANTDEQFYHLIFR